MANPTGAKYTLERPRTRARLIRLLADGHATTVIARYLQTTPGSVSLFKARHKAEITAMQQGMTEAVDYLWIARKVNRITALDTAYADLQDFKDKRIQDQSSATIVPGVSINDRRETHGYEAVEYKWMGDFKNGRMVDVRRFDAALFNAELKVLREAAEELGQIQREPIAQNNNTLVLQQNNQSVNFFDRASVIALANRLRAREVSDLVGVDKD